MTYLERLQKLEAKIQENKLTKAKLEQKKEQLEEEYKKLLTELDTHGIKESDLVQTISNLEIEIEEDISTCEESLK
jgi:hypothetical protein